MFRATTLLLILSTASIGTPLTCSPGTLADYLSLAPDGCRLGGRVLSDFVLGEPAQGSLNIAPEEVQVTPSLIGTTGALRFTFDRAVTAGMVLESVFGLTVRQSAPDRITFSLNGASATGDAVVAGVAELCTDASSGSTCQGIAILRTAFDDLSTDSAIGPVQRYTLTHDIVIDAGATGSAGLSSTQLTFTPIPEPATWVTMAAAFALMVAVRRRSKTLS